MLRSDVMATTTHVSLSDYLATSDRPDREYAEGEIRERNVGKFEHARLIALLAMWFGKHDPAWGVIGSPTQRVQVVSGRYGFPTLWC